MTNEPRTPQWAEELHKPKKFKVIYGGRLSGKSWQVADALVQQADAKELRIACMREHQSSIRESSYGLVCTLIQHRGLQERFDVLGDRVNHKNGSKFAFWGLFGMTENNFVRSRLIKADRIWVEEAQRMTQSSWDYLQDNAPPDAEIWLTFNPEYVDDPAYREFVLPETRDDAYVVRVNYNQNPDFPAECEQARLYDRRLYDREHNRALYDHIWLGFPLGGVRPKQGVAMKKWEYMQGMIGGRTILS